MANYHPDINDSGITGPIVACENAIDHYRKQVELTKEKRDEARRQLNSAEADLNTYDQMLDQWVEARKTLIKAQGLEGQ